MSKIVWAIVSLLWLALPRISLAGDVSLMTEVFPPYQFYRGSDEQQQLTGISVEIVTAIQQKLGHTNEIKVYPWSRGLKLLKKRKNTALFSTARTPARENLYQWVGPLATLEIVFFKKRGSSVTITSVDEAKQLNKIGVTKNVATHEILTNLGFSNLDVVQSGADEKNIKRLVKGRIDAWPTAYYAGVYNAKKLGYGDQIEVIDGVSLMTGYLYLAFNKGSDPDVIQRWQTALDQLRSEGKIQKILERYGI